MDSKWIDILNDQKIRAKINSINEFLDEEYKHKTIFPPRNLIYNAFDLVNFDDVRVIILGQDPYHEQNQAMGLAFSVPKGIRVPPSLRNIYKEIEQDCNITMDLTNGDLTYLAKQGVLFLNPILTVEEGRPLSHKNKGWEEVTDFVIEKLNEDNKPKVFVLWGGKAQEKEKLITNKNHLILKANHPSPLSAYRGFFGCKHFSKINQFVINNHSKPIEWSNN